MSIFFPKHVNIELNTKLSKEESIAALVMLGWEQVLPNLLLKSASFTLSASIGIMDDGHFIFIDDKTGSIDNGDSISYTFDDPEHLLIYSPNTIVQVVLDNTNG